MSRKRSAPKSGKPVMPAPPSKPARVDEPAFAKAESVKEPALSSPVLDRVEGATKLEYLRRVLGEYPGGLDAQLAEQLADYLSRNMEQIAADKALIEHHLRPRIESLPKPRPFNPHAFSLMKVYRTSGETGLREKLRDIVETGHLQALAQAQKISLPIRLRTDSADPAGLKEAIVRGVISRFQDWQAAS